MLSEFNGVFIAIGVFICIIGLWNLLDYVRMNHYFNGITFFQLKNQLAEPVCDLNELFSYNEEVKRDLFPRWVKEYQKKEYEPQQSKLNSLLNSAVNQHDCSSSVCGQAQQQPVKYLCKYFGFSLDEDTLFIFQNILSDYNEINSRTNELLFQREQIYGSVSSTMPKFRSKRWLKLLPYRLGLLNQRNFELTCPSYLFLYTSPKGKSTKRAEITLDFLTVRQLVDFLTVIVGKKSSGAYQRALMTSELREKIKKRDKYSCVCCGVSLRDEPHLLLEIDHIIPVSKGGKSVPENLQTLCWKCNRSKGSKMPI